MKFLVVLVFSLLANSCFAWGLKGQQITALIAENYLSPSAKKRIEVIAGKESLASFAGWADSIRGRSEWKYTSGWHYINVDINSDYSHTVESTPQDIVDAIEYCVDQFQAAKENKDKLTWLKFIVHFVGDIHQPLHSGSANDRGGNQTQVVFGRKINLHSLWDSYFIDEKISLQSYVAGIMKEGRSLTSLTVPFNPDDAVIENLKSMKFIYSYKNGTIDSRYETEATAIVKDRLWMGGIRLASLLNSIL